MRTPRTLATARSRIPAGSGDCLGLALQRRRRQGSCRLQLSLSARGAKPAWVSTTFSLPLSITRGQSTAVPGKTRSASPAAYDRLTAAADVPRELSQRDVELKQEPLARGRGERVQTSGSLRFPRSPNRNAVDESAFRLPRLPPDFCVWRVPHLLRRGGDDFPRTVKTGIPHAETFPSLCVLEGLQSISGGRVCRCLARGSD
jgi:hypothetical protein